MLVEAPGPPRFHLRGVEAPGVVGVRLMETDEPMEWSIDDDGRLWVELPPALPVSAAHVLRIQPADALQART